MKKQVLAAFAAFALGAASASASTITYDVRTITNATFGDYQAGWSAQSSSVSASALSNFNGATGSDSGYDHLSISFDVGSAFAGSSLAFEFAPDAGYGGSIYVDGTLVQTKASDLWWGGSWSNLSQLLTATLGGVSTGTHTIDLYWAENCCNGGQGAQFSVNGGAWEDVSVSNLNALNVPEPGSLALLGLGLTGAFLARRKQA